MAFYVKLGPRGILFRVGTGLIGLLGSVVYWRASRRRGKMVMVADAVTIGREVRPQAESATSP